MRPRRHKFRLMPGMALISLLICAALPAQSPEKMSYQAVVRNTENELISNQEIGMRISILKGSVTGTEVYNEVQTPVTNSNGLVSVEFGGGTGFSDIDWSDGPFFLKTEFAVVPPLTTYTIEGTAQLLSVPYALFAKTAETVTGTITETDPRVPVGTQPGEMQYWNGSAWVTILPGAEGQSLRMVGGVPTWKTTMGVGDVLNPATGRIWIDRNLGALQAANSSTDGYAYGDLFQWGRSADGHQIRTSGTTTTLSDGDMPGHGNFILVNASPNDWRSPQNDNLWQGVSGINNPCPTGYRLPTYAEWHTERGSWSTNNAAGAFTSPLKLPSSGFRLISNGSVINEGSYGFYWSSTVSGTNSWDLFFHSSNAGVTTHNRGYGSSVRCIKD